MSRRRMNASRNFTCARLLAVESRLSSLLRDSGGAGGDGLLKSARDGRQFLRADEPAKPPSRHGEGFREARDHENPIHGTNGASRDVPAFENDVFVDLVADDIDAGAPRDLTDIGHQRPPEKPPRSGCPAS